MSLYDELPQVYGTGEILSDGRTDWKKEKLRSNAVSVVMPTEKRQERMAECSSFLEFASDLKGNKRLHRANFCKDRMCPACQRRRSLKVFHQIKDVCTALMRERPSTCFLMLTLTVPNIHKDDLSETISHMFKSWDRLTKRAEFRKPVIGWFRSLEITAEKSSRDGYFHPHFHVLIAVPSYYFKTKAYIKQSRWLELWQEATRQPEITQVDVRRVKPSKKRLAAGAVETNPEGGSSFDSVVSAAAEVGKYATKPGDYLARVNSDLYLANESIVSVLAEALKGRKIIAFGGEFKKILAALGSDDVDSESTDLVHVGDQESDIDAVIIQIFRWHSSHNNYIG